MLETLSRTLEWQSPPEGNDLVREYQDFQVNSGYVFDGKIRPWAARAFLLRYPDLVSWRQAPLDEQLSLHRSLKYFASFLFLKHYLQPTMLYLFTARPQLAKVGKRFLYTPLYTRLYQLGKQLGYGDAVLGPTFNMLFYVMVYSGKGIEALDDDEIQAFNEEMRTIQLPAGFSFSLRTYSQHLYRIRVVLFHAGIFPELGQRYSPHPARAREVLWATIPQPICQVVWRYLDQLDTVRATDTVKNNEGCLRRFFVWLAQAYPEVQHLRQITRVQIEDFKGWLQETTCMTGKEYHRHTRKSTLSALRCFFQAIQEWDWPEAPEHLLIFARDLPIPDQPLPRFLDDPKAAALLRAARASRDLFTRVCVELLLRTGLRKGEFIRLQLDSVAQIGESYWLRVPLGKLHNDRYVPLHPEVKQLLDEWMAQRSQSLRTNDLFVVHGRRVSLGCVDDAVKRAAQAAGIEEAVSPHRLRHTLATQAINRGMTLEAIAALLGHRSMTMTLIYARIANQTVQAQYASVCQDLDKLYSDAALSNPQASATLKDGKVKK
jgi:site-specific recombinase XerD